MFDIDARNRTGWTGFEDTGDGVHRRFGPVPAGIHTPTISVVFASSNRLLYVPV